MYNQPSISQSYKHNQYPMANYGIHGNLLEVTVVGCENLKDTEWISRQDPYVCVEYGSNRNSTRVCIDGGTRPTFQEKFVYNLIEGLRELNIVVWNSNTLQHDDFIGSGKVQLAKVLSSGYDDSSWPLQTKSGRRAGEVRLIMHCPNANITANSYAPSASLCCPVPAPYSSTYSTPPPALLPNHPQAFTGAYSVPSPYSCTPNPSTYLPSPYPPNAGVYPPSLYPPQAATYPLQPYDSSYAHCSSYPGMYPPPPY